jgi:hypothetical protein
VVALCGVEGRSSRQTPEVVGEPDDGEDRLVVPTAVRPPLRVESVSHQGWASSLSWLTGIVAPGRRPSSQRSRCSSDRKRFIVCQVNTMSSHHPAAGRDNGTTGSRRRAVRREPHTQWAPRSRHRMSRGGRRGARRRRCRRRPRRSWRTTIVRRCASGPGRDGRERLGDEEFTGLGVQHDRGCVVQSHAARTSDASAPAAAATAELVGAWPRSTKSR